MCLRPSGLTQGAKSLTSAVSWSAEREASGGLRLGLFSKVSSSGSHGLHGSRGFLQHCDLLHFKREGGSKKTLSLVHEPIHGMLLNVRRQRWQLREGASAIMTRCLSARACARVRAQVCACGCVCVCVWLKVSNIRCKNLRSKMNVSGLDAHQRCKRFFQHCGI